MSTNTKYSYASFGCAAFADNHRTWTYHNWAMSNGMYPTECCPSLLDCSCTNDDPLVPHADPVSDPAPWYDATLPESGEFLGVMIMNISGIRDSTFTRDVADAFGDGSILGRPRKRGKTFVLEMVVMGTSCAGIDYGLEWLRRLFEDEICSCSETDPCAACVGKQLTVRVFCGDDPDCDTGLRTWDSVGVVDGIKVVDDEDLRECCCTIRRATMTLQSESPYSFNCEVPACTLDTSLAERRWESTVESYDPVAWWRLEERTGTVAGDSSATGNHDGTYNGFPAQNQPGAITNEITRSVLFDNTDDYVEVPDDPALDFGIGPFTVMAWFKRSSSGGFSVIASKKNAQAAANAGWWLGFTAGDALTFELSDGATQVTQSTAGAAYLDGAWHFVVAGVLNGTTRLYIDGNAVGVSQIVPGSFNNAIPVNIGRMPGEATSYFDGYIDEVALFSYGFSEVLDVQPLYAIATATGFFARCFDWSFDCKDCSTQECCDRCGYDALCTCYPIADPEIVIEGSDCFCPPLEQIIQCCCVEDVGGSYDTALKIDIYSGSMDVGQSSYKARVKNDIASVGYWRLGEAAGTVANDEFTINPGTYNGSPTLGVDGALLLGDPDTAVEFDQVDDYVEVPYSAVLNPASFTLEAWVDWNNIIAGNGRIISSLDAGGPGGGYELFIESGGTNFAFRTRSGGVNDDLLIPAQYLHGGYHHVVATYDAGTSTKSIYVDGVLRNSTVVAYTPNAVRPLRFGASSAGAAANFWGGSIDEVAIYNTAMLAAEVDEHWTRGIADDYFNEIGMRNVRIKVYDNPDNLPCITDEDSYDDWCFQTPRFDLTVDYIPADSTLTIDGRKERVTLDCDGTCRPYDQVVTSTDGQIFPLVTGCVPMMVCVEFDSLNTLMSNNSNTDPATVDVTTYRRWFN